MKLTQTVKKGGCAAKVAAVELRKLLAGVNFPPSSSATLIDGSSFDDAAVYRVSDELAMVQTIDFFTPILDSPFDFGRVAAANAISDVYAMGGRPVTALAVLAFPLAVLPSEVVTEVLNGACSVLTEAGATLAGGHSIDDDTLKFGLSVTGLVHPDRIWANAGARPGDVLIITKGLGTGTITAGFKREALTEEQIRPAVESMALLNDVVTRIGAELATAVHGATDVTGFGLSGHSMQMAKASGVRLEIDASKLPRLVMAEECLAREFLTKAHRTNAEYTAEFVDTRALSPIDRLLTHDPQTSGGLLLAVEDSRTDELLTAIRDRFPLATVIGRVFAAADESQAGQVTMR